LVDQGEDERIISELILRKTDMRDMGLTHFVQDENQVRAAVLVNMVRQGVPKAAEEIRAAEG
jgi:hypothetical protein